MAHSGRAPGFQRFAILTQAPCALHFAHPATTLQPIAQAAVKAPRKKPAAPSRSVVIVDDEKSYVELMAEMIADNLDCSVHAFTRPLDALGALSTISAGVIITDYFMPEMDGIEFIRRASKVARESVFIMISGHNLEPLEYELSTAAQAEDAPAEALRMAAADGRGT